MVFENGPSVSDVFTLAVIGGTAAYVAMQAGKFAGRFYDKREDKNKISGRHYHGFAPGSDMSDEGPSGGDAGPAPGGDGGADGG